MNSANLTLLKLLKSATAATGLGLGLMLLAGCREAISETPTDSKEATSQATPRGEVSQHEGVVMSATAKPFVIMSDDGMQHSFIVLPETKIQVDGHDAKIEAVKVGDTAKVAAQARDGQLIALAITVESTHVARE